MSLIGSLDRKPYQAFTIEHGIERIRVQIPLKEVRTFEAEFENQISTGKVSKEELLRIVSKNGGSVRKKVE